MWSASATGGAGGIAMPPGTGPLASLGGAGGTGVGGDLIINGARGGSGIRQSGTFAFTLGGAAGPFGGGGPGTMHAGLGATPECYGSGGGGGSEVGGGSENGGPGAPGVVIVYEYSS
jgi:hypothetical protein